MMTGPSLCGAVTFSAEHVETEHRVPLRNVPQNFQHQGRFASSDWAERGFCKTCGTTLFYFLK